MITIEIPLNPTLTTSRWCVAQLRETLQILLYHRLQIPVPYLTLGVLVDQLKSRSEEGGNFFLEKHRTEAVNTHQQVRKVVDHLEDQVIRKGLDLDYAAIAFGPTPVLSKEVYFIRLPRYRDHLNENHQDSLQQTVARTMLTLITDERLASVFNSPLALTNMHVLLKATPDSKADDDDECLEEISCFRLPRSCKTFLVDLCASSDEHLDFVTCSCVETEIHIYDDLECGIEVQCSQMTITEDVVKVEPATSISLESISDGKWFQLNTVVKGFKDVLSNGQKIWAS